MKAADIYQTVTDELIRLIEQGIANPKSWTKPWAGMSAGHRNIKTGNAYLGFNQLILTMTALDRGYAAPVWATYRQWQELDAQVAKGEHGVNLVKWVEPRKEAEGAGPEAGEDKGQRRVFPVGFTVFNVSQVQGFTYVPEVRPAHERKRAAEQVIRAARADGLTIVEAEVDQAFYDESRDRVVTPPSGAFTSADTYYATKFHEITHATSHPKRLKREGGKKFGDRLYAAEELVAELGSAYLCAATGIEDTPSLHHAEYLAGWAAELRDNPLALSIAAKKGQDAANYWTSRVVDLQVEVTKEPSGPSMLF